MSAKPGNALSKEATLQGGRYVIESTLGQGGFGITYRATDTRLSRTVAIKELYPGGSERTGTTVTIPTGYTRERWSKAVADFSREARTLSSLDHPGIVNVHDHFEENNTAYMVMHYIHGVNLLQRMKQEGGRLSEDEVLRYMSEVGDALSVLHNSKLLHRDIKPSNIMLNRQGHTVLIDFGAARAFLPDKTATYSVVLTQGFAPPEQVVGRGRLGPTADIYALAATCYYLLTGDLPTFGDDGKLDDNNVSPGLRRALGHGLEFNPAERPQDVPRFIAELQGRIAPPPLTPTTKPATQPVQPPSAPDPKREEYETEVPDLSPPMPYLSGVSASNVSASNISASNVSAVSAIARAEQEKGESKAPGRPSLNSAPTIVNGHPGTISAPTPKPPFTSIRDKERKPGASWLVMGSTIAVLLLLGGVSIVLGGRSSGGGTFITSADRQATSTTLASAAGLSTQQAITRAADATHTSEAQAQAQATAQTLAQNSVTQATTQSQSTAQALVLRTAQVQATAQSVGTSTAEVLAQQQATVQALAQVYAQQTAVQATAQVQIAAQAQGSQTALALEAARHANAQSTANAQATVQASAQAQAQQATATSQAQARATTRAAQAQATAQAVVRTTATAAALANAQAPPILLRTLTDPESMVGAVLFSSDGQILVELAEQNGGVRSWRVADGTLMRTLQSEVGPIDAIALSPDGQTWALLTGSTVELQRVSDSTYFRYMSESGPSFAIGFGDVAFSPDGQTLASTAGESNVHLWRVADGKEEYILPGGQPQGPYTPVAAVAFSPDGQILAGAAGDAVRLWRVADGALLRTLTGSAPIAFSPDGQTLASSWTGDPRPDSTVRLWRVADGVLVKTLHGHTDVVTSVAFSPDGRLLASGSADRTIRLWRAVDDALFMVMRGHTDTVTSVAFSPDGQTLASGSLDKTIKLWRVH